MLWSGYKFAPQTNRRVLSSCLARACLIRRAAFASCGVRRCRQRTSVSFPTFARSTSDIPRRIRVRSEPVEFRFYIIIVQQQHYYSVRARKSCTPNRVDVVARTRTYLYTVMVNRGRDRYVAKLVAPFGLSLYKKC